MNWKNFFYYGFDKEQYDGVRDLKDHTNRIHTEIIATMFLVMMAGFYSLSVFGIVSYSHRSVYLIFLVAAIALLVLLFAARKFTTRHSTFFMYALIFTLMGFSVSSSRADTFQVAVAFPVFVALIGVSFFDNMIRFPLVLTFYCIFFTYSSYQVKPPSLARADFIDALVFTGVALFFHYRFQHGRIEQFMQYHKNLKIQRDLVVTSSFDALSGLLIRARFFSMADTVLRGRSDNEYMALCVLDMDSFKQINDRFGHQMGDKAIQTAGEVIWETLGEEIGDKWSFCERVVAEGRSFAGRLGGDEFVILFRNHKNWNTVHAQLQRILETLNAVELGELHGIQASFGVAEISQADRDVDAVYSRADEALYRAKESGKNQIVRG